MCIRDRANAQCVTWATEAGLSAIQRTGYGECWRPSTRLGISADYNVNNVFSMKSGLYYTFRGYSVNNEHIVMEMLHG